jgi:sugar/nucleoside kinase (ribokinase family)
LISVTVIGCVNVDLLLAPLLDIPLPGTAAFVERMDLRVGGAGANAALALLEAGMEPRLVGAVGDDHYGRWVLEQLGEFGLAEDIVVDPAQATGLTVAVEAPGRDRSFITYLGVTGTATADIVPPSSLAAEHVLVCDYFCAPAMRGEPTARLLRTARENGARTYFDTAWDTDSVTKAGRDLQRRSGGWVVIKLGADGCVAFGPQGGRLSSPAPVIEPTDTTGAGDAFNAGLVSAFASGRGWPEALEAATGLASSLLARPSNDRHTVGKE